MRRFTNILFCPLGDKGNPAAARRVADLAARNGAKLTLFGVIAEPSRLQRALHRADYIDAIQEAEARALTAKLARCAPDATNGLVETRIASGSSGLRVIERVLIADHDLVVVTTDEDDEDRADIKRLLRKCPCPVWVIRPTRARIQRVLAAVNPEPSEAELNRTILELAASMVNDYGGELHVVHAWKLYGEATLSSSAFIQTATAQIEALLESERASHVQAFHDVLSATGLETESWHIHLEKGPPAVVVREVVARHRINLLVMGTVARTGVAGLIMGNTAEAVLNSVRCSVIAIKPPGFVSPLRLVAN